MNAKFLFKIMNVLLAEGERTVIHNVLLEWNISFNTIYYDFAECRFHPGDSTTTILTMCNKFAYH